MPLEADRKVIVAVRSKLLQDDKGVDNALKQTIADLLPGEAARVPSVVRARAVRGAPLDGRAKHLKLSKPSRAVEAETEEEKHRRQQQKYQEEQVKRQQQNAEGKDVYAGERKQGKLPQIKKLSGAPMDHNLSCHICSQGKASWRGNPFADAIGCKNDGCGKHADSAARTRSRPADPRLSRALTRPGPASATGRTARTAWATS